jgi:hypothetical protein
MSIERDIEAPIIVMSPIGTHSPVEASPKFGSYRLLNCCVHSRQTGKS